MGVTLTKFKSTGNSAVIIFLHIIVINTEYKLPSFHVVEDKFVRNLFFLKYQEFKYAVFMWLYTEIYLLYDFFSFFLSLPKEITIMAGNKKKDGKWA